MNEYNNNKLYNNIDNNSQRKNIHSNLNINIFNSNEGNINFDSNNENNINYQFQSSFRQSQNNFDNSSDINNDGMILPTTNFTGYQFRSFSHRRRNNNLGNNFNIYNTGSLLAHRYGYNTFINNTNQNNNNGRINMNESNNI